MNVVSDTAAQLAHRSLVHSFLERAAVAPDEVFATFEGRTDLSLGATVEAIRRFAGALQARGLAPGARVLLALDNSPDFLVSWLGAWYAGAVTIPVVPDAGLRVYERAVAVGAPAFAVAGAEGSAKLAAAGIAPESLLSVEDEHDGALAPALQALVDGAAPAPENLAGGLRLASVMFTSGTTGLPKGVCLSDLWFVWASHDVAAGMSYGPGDTVYTCLPLGHANAQDTTFGPALVSGARVAFDRRFSASRFWERIAATDATSFNLIGNMPRVLLNRAPEEYVEGHRATRAFAVPALPHYAVEFARRFNVALRAGYGSTEVGVPIFQDADAPADGSCGRPVAGTHVRIARPDGLPADPGEVGDIWVWSSRPGAITSGYLDDPARSAQAWRDGWLQTGDLGWLDDGDRLHFAGRSGELLRRKGENISAHEIESAILELGGVEDCAIAATRGDDGDDVVVAWVVPSAEATVSAGAVVDHCVAVLGRVAAPSDVRFVASLPKTESGKVAKAQLAEAGGAPA